MCLFKELFTREKASSKPVLFLRRLFSMLLFPFFNAETSVFHLDAYSTLHRRTLTHILPIQQVRFNCGFLSWQLLQHWPVFPCVEVALSLLHSEWKCPPLLSDHFPALAPEDLSHVEAGCECTLMDCLDSHTRNYCSSWWPKACGTIDFRLVFSDIVFVLLKGIAKTLEQVVNYFVAQDPFVFCLEWINTGCHWPFGMDNFWRLVYIMLNTLSQFLYCWRVIIPN